MKKGLVFTINIYLENRSAQFVLCSVNDGVLYEILPQSKIIVECCDNTGSLKLIIKHKYESFYNKKWRKALYYFVIDSEFIFEGIYEDTNIVITRERIRKDANFSYDRFFVHNSIANLISEYHFVNGKERMLKDYKKFKNSLILSDLIGEYFIVSIRVLPLFLIVKIALINDNIKVPWFYYFLASFIFLSLMQIGKLFVIPTQKFAKRLAGNSKKGLFYSFGKTDYEEFMECFENENIIEYYSLKYRAPYAKEIEYI